MKYLIIIFFSVFSFKISTANEIRKLPKIFFLDCEQNVIGRHLILIDQVNNKVEIKSPNLKSLIKLLIMKTRSFLVILITNTHLINGQEYFLENRVLAADT